MSHIVNKYGIIKIENEVIARVAGLAAIECYGVVGMGARSLQDGLFHLLKKDSLTKGIHVVTTDTGVSIDIHIMVEYGTNISAIASTLIDSVAYKVKEFVGLTVDHVHVSVVGLRVSK